MSTEARCPRFELVRLIGLTGQVVLLAGPGRHGRSRRARDGWPGSRTGWSPVPRSPRAAPVGHGRAGPGRPGDAGPGDARRRRRRADRGLVHAARRRSRLLVALAVVALAARRGRRPGRPAHRHRLRARRPLRHGGRRVPAPRAQRRTSRAAVGGWVLAIGAMRYAFVAAGLGAALAARPRCRRATGARSSRRPRACVLVGSAGVLPGAAVALRSRCAAVESFGRDVCGCGCGAAADPSWTVVGRPPSGAPCAAPVRA